ncbi:MAG TPA: AMP-binding protein [Syntrophomonadaceae bacterium]|nr:AMP-binding protein [Syntrophomonadaceae bacterium]HPR93010.1 AMP-binding protein [Syntrophomonadaceae bacterium]
MTSVRIMSLIEQSAAAFPNSVALIDVKGNSVSYARLNETVLCLTEYLAVRGIKKNQRIAAVLENGLEMAIAYLAISNIASCVPLGFDFTEENYRYYFEIMNVKFLVLKQQYKGPLLYLAREMDIKIIFLTRQNHNEHSIYHFESNLEPYDACSILLAEDDDIAVVNYTSGTTSKPKIVPRSHINEYYYAKQSVMNLSLTEKDRALILLPMFRGASLNVLQASLASGGTAMCVENFSPDVLFRLIIENRLTWFYAIPTVLQSLTEFALSENIKIVNQIRFINSGGAQLTEELAERVRKVFSAPVFNAYGLTETGWIGYNKFSPKGYKKGSLGVPSFSDIAIMDEYGRMLGKNITGEITVNGPQVIKGYDNGEKVNQESFFNDWFRTGDCGYLDDDGYLFITGRIKEIINRGGEKISPYEVEDAICQHTDVIQAAVFPMPGANGNEDVGAAVVLKTGSKMYLKDMRRFLYGKVVTFKMPTALYILPEIPAGDAGKIQRKKLHETIISLGIIPQPEADENEILIMPRNDTEALLYDIFKKILPVKMISVNDTFFELGGDSLKAAVLFEAIKKAFQLQVPLKYIFKNSSIEDLAEYILKNNDNKALYPFVVPFQEEGSKIPIFFVHALEGEAVIFRHITNNFDPDRPFYAFNFNHDAANWVHPISVEKIAENYIKDMLSIQPEGPYILAGQCIGGVIAYEMGQQLQKAGHEIALLAMYDPIIYWPKELITIKGRAAKKIDAIKNQGLTAVSEFIANKKSYYFSRLLQAIYKKGNNLIKIFIYKLMNKETLLKFALSNYMIRQYNGEIIYFKPEHNLKNISQTSIDIWAKFVSAIKVIPIQGNHLSVFYEENAENTRRILEEVLAEIS